MTFLIIIKIHKFNGMGSRPQATTIIVVDSLWKTDSKINKTETEESNTGKFRKKSSVPRLETFLIEEKIIKKKFQKKIYSWLGSLPYCSISMLYVKYLLILR